MREFKAWLAARTDGLTVNPEGGGSLVVPFGDWRLTATHLVYAPAFGDRLHIHQVRGVTRDGEDWLLSNGVRLGYIWLPAERQELERWADIRPSGLDSQLDSMAATP